MGEEEKNQIIDRWCVMGIQHSGDHRTCCTGLYVQYEYLFDLPCGIN